jgi:cytidylate kinase
MSETDAKPPLIVAIDGPAGAGKSVVARGVARRLDLPYIDTGAMYRAVAWKARQENLDLADEESVGRLAGKLDMDFVDVGEGQRLCVDGEIPGEALRTMEASQGASKVSVFPGVRQALTETQRRLGRERGCVMEGRDIGTIVFPHAPVKIFLTAGMQERARRRAKELREKGVEVNEDRLLREIEERDRRDAERELAPMRPAPDAILLQTDGLTIEEVIERILSFCDREAAHER